MHRVPAQLLSLQNQSYSNATFFFLKKKNNMEIWMITRKTNNWDGAQLEIIEATEYAVWRRRRENYS